MQLVVIEKTSVPMIIFKVLGASARKEGRMAAGDLVYWSFNGNSQRRLQKRHSHHSLYGRTKYLTDDM